MNKLQGSISLLNFKFSPLHKFLLAAGFACLGLSASQAMAAHQAPDTVSPEMAQAISAPVSSLWQKEPQTKDDWYNLQHEVDMPTYNAMPDLARYYKVKINPDKMAGALTYTLTPEAGVAKDKADKVVLFLHGGGYVFGQGLAGLSEALPLCGWEGYKVISVDYRMPPTYPYPQAINDAFAVYKELLKTYKPENIAVFGSSTGGAMTLILALQALDAKVAVPGALIAGSPWAEMGKKGDTYFTNDGVDNILGTHDHLLNSAAKLYANGADMSSPFLSPVNASDQDLQRFPPTLLLSGTRDLFLSNTVRMHQRLLQNHAPAELVVYEGQSHVQYYLVKDAPETKQHYKFLGEFLGRTLK